MARPPDTQVIDNHNKKYTYPFALFMGIGVVKRDCFQQAQNVWRTFCVILFFVFEHVCHLLFMKLYVYLDKILLYESINQWHSLVI